MGDAGSWVLGLWLVCGVLVWGRAGARGICPPRCECDDTRRAAACVGSGLEVVPIQLNPEANHINLTHNRIHNVHYTLGFYTELVTLDISHNEINDLGSRSFESNANLVHLDISDNSIEVLEKNTFTGLKSLISLNLNINKISELNIHAFRDLGLLEELNLSNNKIISFDDGVFRPLINLRVLLLENNQLLDIPTENLAYTVNLELLSLSGNFIENISESAAPGLRRTRRLELAGNVISAIHPAALDGLVALQYLNLNDNNLTAVPTAALSKLSNLTHLSLNGNFFETIPPVSFQSLFHLRHLHLSGLARLFRIDARAFVDNINLERIWMNDNILITAIPTRTFHGNPRLTQISIKNNNIFTLHASHFPLDQLSSLQLAGNPLHCNCTILWLWTLGQEQAKLSFPLPNATEYSSLFVDFPDIFCETPENLHNSLLFKVPESAIRCSIGWITILTIVLSLSTLISVAGSILYYLGALKRCSKTKSKHGLGGTDLTSDLPRLGNGLMYGTNHQRPSDDKMEINRYLMIAPPIPDNYHSTPPWHAKNKTPMNGDSLENMYQQLGYESIPHHKTMDRPHIVYV